MRYRLKHGNGTIAEIDVQDEPVLLYFERDDQPTLLTVGVDIQPDGRLQVGHWPDGEEWVGVIDTYGVEPTA